LLALGSVLAARAAGDVLDGLRAPPLDVELAAAVRSISRPHDPILVFNESQAAYYLADRRPITPFAIWGHLNNPAARSLGIDIPSYIGKLLACHPRAVVVGDPVLADPPFDMRVSLAAAGYELKMVLNDGARKVEIYAPATASAGTCRSSG
jgi:hypothetical protein